MMLRALRGVAARAPGESLDQQPYGDGGGAEQEYVIRWAHLEQPAADEAAGDTAKPDLGDIETQQDKIALKFGFEITDHSMYLYGICKECQKA